MPADRKFMNKLWRSLLISLCGFGLLIWLNAYIALGVFLAVYGNNIARSAIREQTEREQRDRLLKTISDAGVDIR